MVKKIEGCTDERFSILYDNYANTIYRISILYLKNKTDAEDIVADTFLKFMEKNSDFKNQEHEKAWFIRTAINKCKNFLKNYWNKNVVKGDEIYEYFTTAQEKEVLSEVLDLPEKYKAVIYLYYYEGYSTKEIGKFIGIMEASVRSRLHRGRQILKKDMEGEYKQYESK